MLSQSRQHAFQNWYPPVTFLFYFVQLTQWWACVCWLWSAECLPAVLIRSPACYWWELVRASASQLHQVQVHRHRFSLLSALFISGAIGFYYENCANAFVTVEFKAIGALDAQCPGIKPVTTAGPGSVLAALGLCFMLLPVLLCPQPSDPDPLAGKRI